MKHIRTKILWLFVSFTVITVAATGWLIQYEISNYFYSWLLSDLEKQADVFLAVFAYEGKDDSAFAKILAHKSGVRLTIISIEGNVMFDSEVDSGELPHLENHLHRPEIEEAFQRGKGINIRHSNTVHLDYLYFARKIPAEYQRGFLTNAAYLRVSLPIVEVQKAITEIRTEVVLAGTIVFLAMFVASILLSRNISKPLVTIAAVAKRIREGDLDATIDSTSSDEVGEVARSVKAMVEQLKSDINRLKKLEKVRSEFLGNVSHELRTPIFMLQGYLETLLAGALNDPAVNREFLEKAHSNAMRLNALLTDLIEISRIESGDMKMSFRYFPVSELVESLIAEYQKLADVKNIELIVDSSLSTEQRVYGDKERLYQVLANLLDNAIKYTPNGGRVTLRLREEEKGVRIEVEDTGIGIPEEHLDRIFERFYRVDKERSRGAGGTGLGLAIVKHIIEAHNSKVYVSSTVGKGSVFSFLLTT